MNTNKGMNPRKYRRKKLKQILEKINDVGERRQLLGDEIFEGKGEYTESMVRSLDEGTYEDKELQLKWTKFQELTREFDELQNLGADLVAFKHNNAKTKGKYATNIRHQATRR